MAVFRFLILVLMFLGSLHCDALDDVKAEFDKFVETITANTIRRSTLNVWASSRPT